MYVRSLSLSLSVLFASCAPNAGPAGAMPGELSEDDGYLHGDDAAVGVEDAGRMAADAGLPEAGQTDANDGAVEPTFRAVHAIFQRSCAACHIDAVLGELNLETRALAHRQLVGAFAAGALCDDGSRRRVVAGDPEASLLVHKLEGTQDCGAPMPTHAEDRLPDHEIALIRAWITRGAQND